MKERLKERRLLKKVLMLLKLNAEAANDTYKKALKIYNEEEKKVSNQNKRG